MSITAPVGVSPGGESIDNNHHNISTQQSSLHAIGAPSAITTVKIGVEV